MSERFSSFGILRQCDNDNERLFVLELLARLATAAHILAADRAHITPVSDIQGEGDDSVRIYMADGAEFKITITKEK